MTKYWRKRTEIGAPNEKNFWSEIHLIRMSFENQKQIWKRIKWFSTRWTWIFGKEQFPINDSLEVIFNEKIMREKKTTEKNVKEQNILSITIGLLIYDSVLSASVVYR